MVENSTTGEENSFWVVLGGPVEEQGVYEYQRPPGIALGYVDGLFPIVVMCQTEEDADAVNNLNIDLAEYIANNDYVNLKARFRSEEVRNLLRHCKKFHAIVRGHETGVYAGYKWDASFDSLVKDYKYAKWKSFGSLSEALLYMIDKEPYRRQGRAAAPPSQRIAGGAPAPPAPPSAPAPPAPPSAPATPSPAPRTVLERPHTPMRSTMAAPATPAARFAQPSVAVAASSPNITVNRGGAAKARDTDRGANPATPRRERAQVIPATIGGVEPPQHRPVETEILSAQYARMFMEALPEETAGFRAVIRPLLSQHPAGEVFPAVTFGEAADSWLSDHDIDPFFYLPILQARLHSVNARAFGYVLEQELGWYREEGEELWDLIHIPAY